MTMKRITTRRGIVAVGLSTVILVGVGGVAAADIASTAPASASASGQVRSGSDWRVTLVADGSGDLQPGQGAEVLGYTVTNQGARTRTVPLISPLVTADSDGDVVTPGGSSVVGCRAAWFTATTTVDPGVAGGQTGLAPGTSATGTVTVSMSDSGTDQDPCRHASLGITVRVG